MSQADPEHLVIAHRLRSERIAAGKPAWDRRIDVRGIVDGLPEEPSAAEAGAAAQAIALLLRRELPAHYLEPGNPKYDRDLDEIVDVLESLGEDTHSDAEELVSIVNGRLTELYDWADMERVWLGNGPDAAPGPRGP